MAIDRDQSSEPKASQVYDGACNTKGMNGGVPWTNQNLGKVLRQREGDKGSVISPILPTLTSQNDWSNTYLPDESDMLTDNDDVESELQQTRIDLQQVQAQLKAAQLAMEETQTDLKNTNIVLKRTETDLGVSVSEHEKTREDLDNAQIILKDLQRDLDKTQMEAEGLRNDVRMTRAALKAARGDRDKALAELKIVENSLAQLKSTSKESNRQSECDNWPGQGDERLMMQSKLPDDDVDSMSELSNDNAQRIAELEKENQLYLQEISSLRKALHDARQPIEDQNKIEELEKEWREREKVALERSRDLEHELVVVRKDAEKTINEWVVQGEVGKQEVERLRMALKELRTRVQKEDRDREEIEKRERDLIGQINILQTSCHRLEDDLERAKEENNAMIEDFKNNKEILLDGGHSSSEVTQLEQEVKQLRAALRDNRLKGTQYKEEMEHAIDLKIMATERVNVLLEEIVSLEMQLEKAMEGERTANDNAGNATAKIDSLLSDVTNLKHQLDKAEVSMKTANEAALRADSLLVEINDLKEQLDKAKEDVKTANEIAQNAQDELQKAMSLGLKTPANKIVDNARTNGSLRGDTTGEIMKIEAILMKLMSKLGLLVPHADVSREIVVKGEHIDRVMHISRRVQQVCSFIGCYLSLYREVVFLAANPPGNSQVEHNRTAIQKVHSHLTTMIQSNNILQSHLSVGQLQSTTLSRTSNNMPSCTPSQLPPTRIIKAHSSPSLSNSLSLPGSPNQAYQYNPEIAAEEPEQSDLESLSSAMDPTTTAYIHRRTQSAYSSFQAIKESATRRVSTSSNSSMNWSARVNSIRFEMGNKVRIKGKPALAGVIRFKGPTDFAKGMWFGVELDEPIGKNNGTVNGKQYFQCANQKGLFVLIDRLEASPPTL